MPIQKGKFIRIIQNKPWGQGKYKTIYFKTLKQIKLMKIIIAGKVIIVCKHLPDKGKLERPVRRKYWKKKKHPKKSTPRGKKNDS